jgi:putative peptidoglycan lipid II flippase
MARTAVTIAAVTVAARLVGLLRVFVQANAVGAGPVGDTYAAANQLPNIVFDVVAGGALASAVLPVLGGPSSAVTASASHRPSPLCSAGHCCSWCRSRWPARCWAGR